MSKSLKIVLAIVIILGLGAGLVYTGIWIGRFGLNPFADRWMPAGWGMMSGRNVGSWGGSSYSGRYHMMDDAYGQGVEAEPFSIHEVENILDLYLKEAGDPDLYVSDIMIFDNHAYAQILESSTDIGAMEVLVDYQTRRVYPEQGPNMMWNLKYGHMSGERVYHGPGMMMGSGSAESYRGLDLEDFDEMPYSEEDAIADAQDYLDQYSPGYVADDHAVMFYGYYTLHVLDKGEVISMLSVQGYSGQVFYHHWHGELLETDEH